MKVLKSFRYLGAQITAGGKLAKKETDERMRKAAGMTNKLQRLNITKKTKMKVIATKINPMAFYGTENAQPAEDEIEKYCTQFLKAI